MTDIQFYHLTATPLERALPRLLEKALAAGYRSLVVCGSEERAEVLDTVLWTYDGGSFLPHGTAKTGEADAQPVYLVPAVEGNPNRADLLAITDGSSPECSGYKRVLDMFDGADAEAVAAARARWSAYKAQGHTLSYLRQNENGGWEKQQ
jgi:DNA polymerase-3 subunit chi